MRLDQQHYCLTLEVLSGEPHAHKVLADLLEDCGERGLAQWARSRKSSLRKRFDLALGVIPSRTGVALACDFLEHALLRHPGIYSSCDVILEPMAAIREQLSQPIAPGKLRRACDQIGQVDFRDVADLARIGRWPQPWVLGLACRSLADAARSVAQAADSHEFGQGRARFHEEQARLQIRHTARYAREDAGCRLDNSPERRQWLPRRGAPAISELAQDSKSRTEELHWQVEQTKRILEQLIEHG